ncbi:MAG: lysostaphin resistance A-like protein [Promethearchaeota archaeon]
MANNEDNNVDSDLFEEDEISRQRIQEREAVVFDIESTSEDEKTSAHLLLSKIYSKHFIILLGFSLAGIILLYSAFLMVTEFNLFSVANWPTSNENIIYSNAGLIILGAGVVALLFLLEKYIFKQDKWTPSRLGIASTTKPSHASIIILLAMPFLLFLVLILSPPAKFSFGNDPKALLIILYATGSVPVIMLEEIYFRGVYWKYLDMRFGSKSMTKVILINSAMFMLIHVPSQLYIGLQDQLQAVGTINPWFVYKFLIFFTGGLLLCQLRNYFNSLWAPISFHISFNIFSILISTFAKTTKTGFLSINDILILIILLIFIGFFILAQKFNIFKIKAKILDMSGIEGEENILTTKFYHSFRLLFLAGIALVFIYYSTYMANNSVITMIIIYLIIIGSFVALIVMAWKKILIFK